MVYLLEKTLQMKTKITFLQNDRLRRKVKNHFGMIFQGQIMLYKIKTTSNIRTKQRN